MHQVIYALVDAQSSEDAVAIGKTTFDRLIGATPHDSAVFDYYVTFDMDGGSVAGKDRWGEFPVAASVDSPSGAELVGRAWRATVAEFERNLETVQAGFEEYSTREVMADAGLVRHACYNLGAYRGPPIFLYDAHGDGIRTCEHLERVLERLESAWVVPADVHY